MTDVVERLRRAATYDQGHGYYSALADDAADTIERLRAALKAMLSFDDPTGNYEQKMSRQQAALRQARAALEPKP